ncbi:hypothetical protein [Amycolatopsis sp. WGS_07]|uniref:hypothetical protein n=1 Tax=Amycolatopsis sp. WGS_07 TaxID=3076764 RepID=UPI003872A9A8
MREAAVLTSAVGLATAGMNHRRQTRSATRELRWQHVKQLRQQRRDPNLTAAVADATSEWREAHNAVFLLAGPMVIELHVMHRRSIDRRWKDVWRGEYVDDPPLHIALTDAMRAEITDPPAS